MNITYNAGSERPRGIFVNAHLFRYNTLMQPGQTIEPGGAMPPPEDTPPQDVQSPGVVEGVPAETSATPTPSTTDASNQEADSQPPVGTSSEDDGLPQDNSALVTWSASEYVAHHKNPSWFAGLGVVIAAIAIGVYVMTHDLFSPIMVVICGIVFGVFAARQPRVLEYALSRSGITIGQKLYSYGSFKSFSVVEEGHLRSILLTPLQRFMPPISVYYDPKDEDQIMDVMADYLPFTEARRDAVDSLMRRVRF